MRVDPSTGSGQAPHPIDKTIRPPREEMEDDDWFGIQAQTRAFTPTRTRSRYTKWSPEREAEFVRLWATHMPLKDMAKVMGTTRRALSSYRARRPELFPLRRLPVVKQRQVPVSIKAPASVLAILKRERERTGHSYALLIRRALVEHYGEEP